MFALNDDDDDEDAPKLTDPLSHNAPRLTTQTDMNERKKWALFQLICFLSKITDRDPGLR